MSDYDVGRGLSDTNTIVITPFNRTGPASKPGLCHACDGTPVAVCAVCRELVCLTHRRVRWLEWPKFESYCAECKP